LSVSYAQAKEQVAKLVERFARNLDVYKRADYKEARVRVEFVDPLFEALGWDVRNEQGHAEQYKDVVHEDAIKISGATRAPDYCFRVGGLRKFFLEVKKPAVSVRGDVGPAYQLRRYAWSAKLPLSILTDFEEFAVYDCRRRPKPADKASVGRITYLRGRQETTSVFEIAHYPCEAIGCTIQRVTNPLTRRRSKCPHQRRISVSAHIASRKLSKCPHQRRISVSAHIASRKLTIPTRNCIGR